MPWVIVKNETKGYCVHKENEDGTPGEELHCYVNEQDAKDYLTALYANVPDATRTTMKAFVFAAKSSTEMELDVLGVPFGGPINGRDKDGEFFDINTNIHQDKFPEIPAVYYHGLDPKTGKPTGKPEYIGKAHYVKQTAEGHWYKVILNKASEFAKKVWEAALKGLAGASSGSILHLMRVARNGHIEEWPLAELTLTDGTGKIKPANSYAVVLPALKTLYEEAGMKLSTEYEPEGNSALEEGNDKNININTKTKDITMPKNVNQTQDPVQDEGQEPNQDPNPTPAIKTGVLGILDRIAEENKKQAAAMKAQADEDAALEEKIRELVQVGMQNSMKAAPAVNRGRSANLNLKTKLGDSEEKAFNYYLRTGDKSAIKTNVLNETGEDAGGVIVPDDFYSKIVEKRDEVSIARIAGATVIQTGLKVVDIPVEGTEEPLPVITGESSGSVEASYDETVYDPFDLVPTTVYKYTRMVRISEELLEDAQANIEAFLTSRFGRAFGKLENNLFINGSGTSAPQGVVYATTGGVTAESSGSVSAADVIGLYYSLSEPYRDGASWAMKGDTEAIIRGLTGNPFSFAPTPQSTVNGKSISTLVGSQRVFNSAYMPAATTGLKSILFGNWEFYAIAERRRLTIRRLNERYAENGEVAFLASVRIGGRITQADAFKVLTQP